MEKDFNFEEYEGNLRLSSISFDALFELYGSNPAEYDRADNEADSYYVGKIGVIVPNSYFKNEGYSATVQVKFSNGYIVLATTNDVVPTDEEMTWDDFLPDLSKGKNQSANYSALTEDEKRFSDLLIIQMATGLGNKEVDFDDIVDSAIGITLQRTLQQNLLWVRPEFSKD